MTDYERDTSAVQGATDRLITAVTDMPEEAVDQPSLLPGWSRGHVLAHLARNADALVNLLTSARTGERIPMYENEEARDAEIDRDSGRPLAVHLDDLRTTAFRFNSAAAALTRDHWSVQVAARNGTMAAGEVPFRRLIEVELHHVDLGIGYRLEDLDTEFVVRQVGQLAGRFAGRPEVPALRLASADGAQGWDTGRAAGPGERPLTVTGSPVALLGWLTGRADGAELACADGPLPTLPPLG